MKRKNAHAVVCLLWYTALSASRVTIKAIVDAPSGTPVEVMTFFIEIFSPGILAAVCYSQKPKQTPSFLLESLRSRLTFSLVLTEWLFRGAKRYFSLFERSILPFLLYDNTTNIICIFCGYKTYLQHLRNKNIIFMFYGYFY